MKSLYINNQRLLIPDNTYFPFTHTISDLENITLIGVPSSKSISIPRCVQNDEIFGYVGNLTRANYTFSSDYYIGVSFNQIKKCFYILYDDSIIVSQGLLTIDSINEKEYQITLYDELLKKLEEFDGDDTLTDEENNYYLTSIDLLSGSTNPISFQSNAVNIKSLVTGLTLPIVPVVGIRTNNNDLDDKSIRCSIVNGSTTYPGDVDLPIDCTSLQLRTLKSYEFNYATPISKVIEGINYKYGNAISYDNNVQTICENTYMLLNNPINEENSIKAIYTNFAAYTSNYVDMSYRVIDSVSGDTCITNGNKSFKINLEAKWTGDTTSVIGGVLQDGFGTWAEKYYMTDPDGTLFTKQWAKVWLSNNGIVTTPIYYEIDFYKNENAMTPDANVYGGTYCNEITVNAVLNIDFDFYPQFMAQGDISSTYLNITLQNYDPAKTNYKWKILDGLADVKFIYQKVNTGMTLTESVSMFRSNDLITTKKIIPKISIKNFLIQLAKFFNFDLVVEDQKLKLQLKNYYQVDETLLIDSISNINTTNITFNKLLISNSLPKNKIFEDYKRNNKVDYDTQIINTGYSIKNNVKQIKLETAIPILYRDHNSWAYHIFSKYSNGGYCKHNHGIIDELSEKLTFCYVSTVQDKLYVTDDTPFEGGMNTATITGATEIKFSHYNPRIYANTGLTDDNGSKFLFSGATTDDVYGCSILNSYYTVTPYFWSGNTITKSLEFGKSNINYAGITDIQYPTESTLYYRHHRNMLIDKYNSNTHLLTAKIYIEGKIDVYKIYNYQNSNYIISKIIEYDPTTPGVYDVELMRVNDTTNYTTNIIL